MTQPDQPNFRREDAPEYTVAQSLSPLITRILCENPGPYTYTGTGTYLVGTHDIAVIDPGPMSEDHLQAIMDIASDLGGKITHILVTHTHADHSTLARPLADATGATIYAFGPHGAGRKDRITGLEDEVVEAGADNDFVPDITLIDGSELKTDEWTIKAIHTPGHTANHLCFVLAEENACFTGDHVMSWTTTVISPPDGDMKDYLESLEKLRALDLGTLYPTHGLRIREPNRFLRAIIVHRRMREGQLLKMISEKPQRVMDMVAHMYRGVDKRLHLAASRSVLAHLISMVEDGRISCDGPIGLEGVYRLP